MFGPLLGADAHERCHLVSARTTGEAVRAVRGLDAVKTLLGAGTPDLPLQACQILVILGGEVLGKICRSYACRE